MTTPCPIQDFSTCPICRQAHNGQCIELVRAMGTLRGKLDSIDWQMERLRLERQEVHAALMLLEEREGR